MNTVSGTGIKEKAKLIEMILCSPGMAENCKLSFKISRQNALLLARLIETGILSSKEISGDDIFSLIPEGAAAELKVIHEEILSKTGLTEFYEKMKDI